MGLFKRFNSIRVQINRGIREKELRKVSKLFEFHDNAKLLEHNLGMLQEIIKEPLTIQIKVNAIGPCYVEENEIVITYKKKKYKPKLLHKNFLDIRTLSAAIEQFQIDHKL